MTEDKLLTRIGRHARDEQKDDALFERVARGEADGEELAELERAAASDPDLAMRLEASRPLDGQAAERIATHARAALSGARSKSTSSAGARTTKQEAKVEPKTTADVVRLVPPRSAESARATWKRRVVIAAGPLALAAAMVLYIAGQRGPTGPELPPYSVTATGEQTMRGPGEASARLHLARGSKRDARFELVLRPQAATQEKVVAYAFTVGEAGAEPAPLDAKVEIAPEGSVRMTGPSRMLDGVREIRIVVGAPAAIGKFDDAAARAKSNSSSAQIRVLVVPIDRD